MADDGRGIHIPEPPCLAGKRNGSSAARSQQGQEIRVRDRRHSPAVRVQHTHRKPYQEKRKDRQSRHADRTQNHRRCGHGTGTGRTQKRGTQIRRQAMEYRERKEVTPEEAVILWQASRLDLSDDKRNCVPDGIKVGSISLSPRGDLRMPSDMEYKSYLKELDELEKN